MFVGVCCRLQLHRLGAGGDSPRDSGGQGTEEDTQLSVTDSDSELDV